ncbi:hypothetical protein BKA56DRAFT_550287 [Ilyonectria sp. MPI-CAGE-AT-0026]|nr:hypothetical protein BKA56DRAFT_550287 [Ilyonectria sp. MPI-CAGE-AT-0026]
MATPSAHSSDESNPARTIHKTTFRTASPNLRPLPVVDVFTLCPESISKHKRAIVKRVHEILEKYNLDDESDVSFPNRQILGDPNSGRWTLFIVTTWNDESLATWPRAVREMVDFVDETFQSSALPQAVLDVEMIAPERIMDKNLGLVSNNPALRSAWPSLSSLVRERLEFFEATSSHFKTIALFRLGFSMANSENPITVYITVDLASDETEWPGIVDDILSALANRGWPQLHVHIEHDASTDRCAFDVRLPTGDDLKIQQRCIDNNLILPDPYEQRVDLGQSISASRYLQTDQNTSCNSPIGTLGCYVEIRTKSKPQWTKYGLTNYHVVRPCLKGYTVNLEVKGNLKNHAVAPPSETSELWDVDDKGYWPSREGGKKVVESPARVKHNYTMWWLNETIRGLAQGTEQWEEHRANKIAFFNGDHHIFGHLFAASGFRRRSARNNHRMDWALLDVHSIRQGKNLLPKREVWLKKTIFPDDARFPRPETSGSLLKDQESSLKNLPGGSSVFKVGTTTKATIGAYSEYKTVCKLSDDNHMKVGVSEEFTFIGQPVFDDIFIRPGDSGSVVFDKNGCVLGLAFMGWRPQQSRGGYGYVTPIEDIFADIKSGGTITDIRIAID